MGFLPVEGKDIFALAPNFDLLKKQKELSYAELIFLLQELNNVSMQLTAEKLKEGTFFPWLTFALGCAVKLADTNADPNSHSNTNLQETPITLIMSITQSILIKSPDALYDMFNQQISNGEFQGQSFTYFWMDNYYSLVGSLHNDLHAFNTIFHELLNGWDSRFCSLLVKNIEEGREKGKNALLVLLRSYQMAAEKMSDYNREQTQLIAELFQKCMQQEPSLMGAALTQEITHGLFRGKSCLYVLSSILPKVVLFGYFDSLPIIHDAMLQALKNHPEQFINSLVKIHAHPGLSSLHQILLSLVEAAYKDKNAEVIAQLMSILTEFTSYDKGPAGVVSALLETIKSGTHKDLNCLVFLCRALIAAMAHHTDVTPIMNFIVDVIQKAEAEQLTTAVFQSAPTHPTPEYQHTPINQVISLAQKEDGAIQKQHAQIIISALANSQATHLIYSQLSVEERFFFANETNLKPNSFFSEPSVQAPEAIGAASSIDSSYASALRLFHRPLSEEEFTTSFPSSSCWL
ncbi:hypothetical protein J2N86_02680 [Legionella lytica]|uniref:Uncharacterized protein n=1 Tax=Legionella lytica TaxID=96232 RepID=A0ABY4YAV1_9GAMM|nr:hypothetical protein [Legionella lytica]USQ14257.1 hypothetical protein J2N86_02680 [Legionella lytica]